MTQQEALDLIEKTETADYTEKQTFLRGLRILAKYDDNIHPSFEHDHCWVCNFEATVAKMTPEDVVELAFCGWHEDEESWAHY